MWEASTLSILGGVSETQGDAHIKNLAQSLAGSTRSPYDTHSELSNE